MEPPQLLTKVAAPRLPDKKYALGAKVHRSL